MNEPQLCRFTRNCSRHRQPNKKLIKIKFTKKIHIGEKNHQEMLQTDINVCRFFSADINIININVCRHKDKKLMYKEGGALIPMEIVCLVPRNHDKKEGLR